MMWQLLTTLLVLQIVQPVDSKESPWNKALDFGTTLEDYVKFYPDMKQVKDAVTVCAWVKKRLTGTSRSWITYKTTSQRYEILISDEGSYNYIHGDNSNVRELVSVPLHTWTHQCNTWTTTSGVLKVYYNGTLVRSRGIDDRDPLGLGGYMVLGHDAGSKSTSEVFGGQLMKLNIFGKEMTGAEIAELYNGGRCSEVEKKYEEIRHITWESILEQERYGKVYEVDSDCPADDDTDEDDDEEEDDDKEDDEDGEEDEEEEKEEEYFELGAAWDILGKL